ncbi:Hyphally regulated cell wall protein 3, partial [Nakaseomyces glabratus]
MKDNPSFSITMSWIIRLMLLIVSAMSQAVIQSNTITYGNNPTGYSNGYIVLGGVYLAFQDMNTVSMFQTLRVNQGGALYYINNNLKGFSISSNHNWFVNFVFQNDGTIVVDDRLSTSAGSWKINDGSFTNTGNIMFTSSQGDTFDISATSVTNTGIIYSKGTNAARPQQLKIGNNANNWYNTGTICLANTTFDLQKSIQGVGCVSVGANSVFNIHDINLQQQSIYLSDPTSVVAVSNGQNMPVSGFGNGNGFLFPLFPIKSFTYDSLTGIIKFTVGYLGLQTFTVPIGNGYNETLFEIVPDNYIQGNHYQNSFFIYKGKPPQSAPSICKACVEIPLYTFKVPEAYETTNELGFSEIISFYSTYNSNNLPLIGTTTLYSPPPVYTITKSDNTTTETEIVSRVVGVDVNGSPITYYTTIIAGPTQPSVVTTTITTTFSGGRESTITTVETANDTMSNPTSISSQPSSISSNNMTSSAFDDGKDRTTVVTNADGSVQTDIVSHITTTDASGNPTTIATTYPSPADD